MTRIFYSLLLIIFCFSPLWSKHILGSDMSYQFLELTQNGTYQYRFKMRLYLDCVNGGATFDDPAQFAIYKSGMSGSVLVENFTINSPVIKRLNYSTNCDTNFLAQICIDEGTYVFQREFEPLLPGESYFVVYQRCCRAESLSNIVNSVEVGISCFVELTRGAMAAQNSSPVFVPYPFVLLCAHYPMYIEQSATDSEGDQLFYTFSSPVAGGGNILNPPGITDCAGAVPTPPCGPPFEPLAFVTPIYSATHPMGGDPVIEMDENSGIISGTPHTIGQFLVGLSVSEFRNGILLSTTKREITFYVVDNGITAWKEETLASTTFKVSPNPATDWVSWSPDLEIEAVQLLDCSGKCLEKKHGQVLTKMEVNALSPGFYQLIGITRSGRKISSPLIVAR